jgi:hypothetical protein
MDNISSHHCVAINHEYRYGVSVDRRTFTGPLTPCGRAKRIVLWVKREHLTSLLAFGASWMGKGSNVALHTQYFVQGSLAG